MATRVIPPDRYTHNLCMLLFDEQGQRVTDTAAQEWLLLMKHNLPIAIKFEDQHTYVINWHHIALPDKATHFMGDLFTYSIYSDDDIVVHHVEKALIVARDIAKVPVQLKVQYYVHRVNWLKSDSNSL